MAKHAKTAKIIIEFIYLIEKFNPEVFASNSDFK